MQFPTTLRNISQSYISPYLFSDLVDLSWAFYVASRIPKNSD